MNESRNYDLTSAEGRKLASQVADVAVMLSPGLALLRWLGAGAAKVLSPDKEAEVARKLIAEGKVQGVKEMKIRLSKKASLDLGAKVEGVPIKFGAEYDGTIEVHVTYK